MGAKRIDGQPVNGKRSRLADVIPLDTPYAITIFPIYACNFKCSYCIHSLPEKERRHVSNNHIMDIEVYKKCIDDLKKFPRKLKVLHFAGLGEPLAHPNIVEMIDYAVKSKIANVVDIVTNGALLNEKFSDQLIDAGLHKIRISLQGLDAEMYKEMSNIKIDFEQLYRQLTYFYQHKKKCSVYIKIMDISLKDKSEQEFIKKFSNIADNLAVEHLCPFVEDIDYSSSFEQEKFIYTMNGNVVPNAIVCPQPFYSLQINPDGDCIPCCTIEKPISIGNCMQENLLDIWQGEKLQSFRKLQLRKEKSFIKACKTCTQYKYGMFPEDFLDDDTKNLLQNLIDK